MSKGLRQIPAGWTDNGDGSYSPPKTAQRHNVEAGVGQIELSGTLGPLRNDGGADHPAATLATPSCADNFPRVKWHSQFTSEDEAISGRHTVKQFVVRVEPMGAPRMTQSDKWKKRPVVLRYFAFKDAVRAAVGPLDSVPDEIHLRFHIPMPDSWPQSKKDKMSGAPHRCRPDYDNLCKIWGDSLFEEDGGIWRGSQEKLWCKRGEERIEATMIWHV